VHFSWLESHGYTAEIQEASRTERDHALLMLYEIKQYIIKGKRQTTNEMMTNLLKFLFVAKSFGC
jgi:hypothetical protein